MYHVKFFNVYVYLMGNLLTTQHPYICVERKQKPWSLLKVNLLIVKLKGGDKDDANTVSWSL